VSEIGLSGDVRRRWRRLWRLATMLCAMLEPESERETNRDSGASDGSEERGAVAALLLGAGRGERLGASVPKAFVPLAGVTLIEHSIRALLDSEAVGWIQPVLGRDDFERFKKLGLRDIPQIGSPVAGGAERQDSVRAGLRNLPKEIRWVAVHDAARCLVAAEDISRVVSVARESGAAILAERVRDTIKRVRDETIVETPPREECWAAQTPQVMRRDWLEEAMDKAAVAARLGTDDAQLLEWAGYPVRIVEARAPNPKITRPEDLAAAETMTQATAREAGERATR
jgi:2-C-methyl-D-erythritol 4-phosphate cytidylyltransferase